MKPKNLPTRKYARRVVALRNLLAKPVTDKDSVERILSWKHEAIMLRERTREQPMDLLTKKHLADGTEARKAHMRGRISR